MSLRTVPVEAAVVAGHVDVDDLAVPEREGEGAADGTRCAGARRDGEHLSARESGMPWQMTSSTEVQHDLGNPR